MSTIHSLSPEILSYIFTFCVEKVDGHFIIPSSKTAPLLLIQICRLWAQVAAGTSELWNSVSLRRHLRAPHGYDLVRDGEGLAVWIGQANVRHAAVELRYDDLGQYGGVLMWNDLIVMALELLHPDIKCDRLHLNLPDDCMEKIFWKLDASDLICSTTRALSLKSSAVELCRNRYQRWFGFGNPNVDVPRQYRMDFNLAKFPALEELSIDFPAPYAICGTAYKLTKLDIAISYWRTFKNCVDLMPNLVEARVVLKFALIMDTHHFGNSSWVARNVRKLEICSGMGGDFGTTKLRSFLRTFHFPQLHTFAMRCVEVPYSENAVSSIAVPLLPFFRNHGTIEKFVLDNFPIPETEVKRFKSLFSLVPKVKHIELRDEEANLLPCIGKVLYWSEHRPICPDLRSLKIHSNIRYDQEREPSITRLAVMLLSRRPDLSCSCDDESAEKKSKLLHRLDHLQLSRHLIGLLDRTGLGRALKYDGLQITALRGREAMLRN